MELNTLWFILVAVLFTGFFVLEGFDFGVGILSLLLGKNEVERRTILRTIGPHWDGNEVWLLTAGGAIFAAFPRWYAVMFSALYLPLFLLLVALILRGLAIEYRNKFHTETWRKRWDIAIFIGSLLAAILVGVAITDLLHGIPLDAKGVFTGNFLDLVHPFPVLAGVASLAVFTWIGLLFLRLKLQGELLTRTEPMASKLRWIVLVVFLALGAVGFVVDPLLLASPIPVKMAAVTAAATLLASVLHFKKQPGMAFIWAIVAIAATSITAFGSLFPNTMVSSLQETFNLTVSNASSTPYTLKIMTIVAAIFVPIVLVYQGFTFWIFRKRISMSEQGGY